MRRNHPPTPSFSKEGEKSALAPSSVEEGVGGGGKTLSPIRRHARSMRNSPTEPEHRLWQALRASQLDGLKFRRQAAKGNRILDFYCPAARIAVEVDGVTHDRIADLERDRHFEAEHGIRTLRFANEDVMRNLEGVLRMIVEAVEERNHPPTPSFEKEGEMGALAPSSMEEGVGGGGA